MKNSKSFLNLTFNILSLVISMGLSFWITPFIINSLGAQSYGFVPLTQQMINYMTVITVSITSISGRFFTIAKKQENYPLAQQYFSSTLSASVVGSAILTFFLVVASIYIDKLINVPQNLLLDVRLSFLLYGAIFLVMFITSVFNIGAFSNNKLYLTSSINIINILIKTVFTVGLLVVFIPKIWYVSLGSLIATFVVMLITIYIFKLIEPQIKIFKFDFSKSREMLSSGMWASLSEVGVILFLQIDLLVSNWNLGPQIAGEYAVVLSLPMILRTFSGTIISIFVPTIISLFALGKTPEMITYINNAVKYTGFALSLPIGIICGLGGTILSLWINPEYSKYAMILAILTIHLSINLSVPTIMSVQTAYNKLKVPAFVTLIMGIINFVVAYVLTKYCNMGVLGIALAGSIVLTFKNVVFTPVYVAHITKQKWNTYLKGIVKPIICTVFSAGLSFLAQYIYEINSFIKLIFVCMCIGFAYILFVYIFMISKNERIILHTKVGGYFGKG